MELLEYADFCIKRSQEYLEKDNKEESIRLLNLLKATIDGVIKDIENGKIK